MVNRLFTFLVFFTMAFATVLLGGLLILGVSEFLRTVTGAEPAIQLRNWGLYNTNRSSIDAPCAWKTTEGNKKITVAVIDTGVDKKHYALSGNLSEIGYDFVSNTSNITDIHGHGTHIAGIIGALPITNFGISGVAHYVTIVPVRYYSDKSPPAVNMQNVIKAINYAVDHDVQIINYSGGGPEVSEGEFLAIKRAEEKGILIVTAAGNDRRNIDIAENAYYPAAYGLKNVISVASTDINNNLAESSNYGKIRVDIAAPGENIYSTLPGGQYGYMTGTSMATAMVSGVAALILSVKPNLKPFQVKKLLTQTADRFPQLDAKVRSGRVNACKAVYEVMHE